MKYQGKIQDPKDLVTKEYADTKLTAPIIETYTIAATAWAELSGAAPFTYSATVTATHTIGADTICELVNDNAVLFATHGFAIGAVSGQNVTIYAIEKPSTSVTLEVNYYG